MEAGRKMIAGGLTIILWLVSAGVAMAEIVYVRDMLLVIYALIVNWLDPTRQAYDDAFWGGVTLSNMLVLMLGVVVVILAVASGEYHAKHWGTRRSWRLFAWVFAIELVIFILALLL